MKRIISAALLAATCMTVNAGVITGELYNTGLNASGTLLASDNGSTDGNWSVDDADAVTYKNSAYLGNDADSKWISIANSNGTTTRDVTFTTTFDLSGYDASTAAIAGSWGVDNWATVYLNGNEIASLPFGVNSFNQLHTFGTDNGAYFIAGLNTLTVEVTNGYPDPDRNDIGPLALRFDNLELSARASEVDEPATLALLGLGLLGLSATRRKQKQA